MAESATYEPQNPTPTDAVTRTGAGRTRRPTLSLIMIVRDEAENIPAVLGPLQGKFDEVIVVDTGSVDNTVELAREHGATVHFFEWINDFAAARNESIRHATGDWLFWLDADDRMPGGEVDRLRSLIALHPDGDVAYYCHLRSLGVSWTNEQNLLQVRLFPNIPDVGFVGEVHERIAESLRGLGVRIEPSPVEIVHVGYVDTEALPEKYARNLEIMTRMLDENPRELQTRYQMIMQLAAMGETEATLEHLEILGEYVAEVSSDVGKTYRYLLLKGIVHRNFGDREKAREAYEEVIETFPNMGVSHYLLATLLYEEDKWDEMREHLIKAEYHGISIDAVPIPLARVLFDMGAMMAMYYRREGQWMLAAQEFRKALALQEEYLPYYLEMGRCYSSCGVHDRALSAYRTGIRSHDTAVERISRTQPERLESGTG
ncbi:MAG: glycosyltransferase, partial [Candidatus Poribacteria bacterium]